MAENEIEAGYFIDLAVFTVAFSYFVKAQGLDHLHVGATESFRRRLMPEFIDGVDRFIIPVVAQPGFTPVMDEIRKAVLKPRTAEQLSIQGDAMQAVFRMLRTRRELVESTFSDPRAVAAAIRLAAASSNEDPATALNALADIPPASRLRMTRDWVREAANILGVGPSAFETAITDARTAKELGAELRSVNAALASSDPTSPDAVALQDRRQELESDIEEVVKSSPSPETALSAAISAAAESSPYLTKTGARLKLSPAQERAMMTRGKALIAAGAGSGKTSTVAGKVAYHVNELGQPIESVMATSFSRKSAAELKERVQRYGVDIPTKAAGGFGTTHSIAARLMRDYGGQMREGLKSYEQKTLIRLAMAQVEMTSPASLNQPDPVSLFPEQGEDAAPAVKSLTFNEAINKAFENRGKLAPGFMRGFLESFFNPKDSWYSQTMRATRNLTDPRGLSDKQKNFLAKVLSATGVAYSVETDPSLGGSARLAAAKKEDRGFGRYESFKRPANQWFNLGLNLTKDGTADGDPIPPGQFAMAITNYKGRLVSPTEAWNKAGSAEAAVYAAYEYLKGPSGETEFAGKGDFDDVLIDAVRFLTYNAKARKQVQGRYRTVIVDEAQDTNRTQYALFGLISGYVDPKKMHMAGTVGKFKELASDKAMTADTFVLVGDDKQAIYAFRSADPDTFIEMSDLLEGGAGFKTAKLDTNYRSGKEIVDAANTLISHNSKQIPMTCTVNPDRPSLGSITTTTFEPIEKNDFREPAKWFADSIVERMEQDPPAKGYSGFGLGVRTNAEAYAYGLELLKKGIPFKSKANFFGDPTTKALVAWLTLADPASTDDQINAAILDARKAPKSKLGDKFVEILQSNATGNYADWLEQNWTQVYGRSGDWANAVLKFVDNIKFVRSMSGESASVILTNIINMPGVDGDSFRDHQIAVTKEDEDVMAELRSQSEDGIVSDEAVADVAMASVAPLEGLVESRADLTESMKYLRTLQQANSKIGRNDDPDDPKFKQPAVTIGTVHSWKGLEVEVMYVPFVGGKFPRTDADEDDLEQDRRLAYVAITRGEEKVHIMDIPTIRMTKAGPVISRSQFVGETCIPATKAAPPKNVMDDDDQFDKNPMGRLASTDFLPLPASGSWLSDEAIAAYEEN